jgi:hypothetical protein
MKEKCLLAAHDTLLKSPEDLGHDLGISRTFVNVVLQDGCPTSEGRLSQHNFFEWLADHDESVRRRAGLAALPPISEADAEWRTSERRKRGFLTFLQVMKVNTCVT